MKKLKLRLSNVNKWQSQDLNPGMSLGQLSSCSELTVYTNYFKSSLHPYGNIPFAHKKNSQRTK